MEELKLQRKKENRNIGRQKESYNWERKGVTPKRKIERKKEKQLH